MLFRSLLEGFREALDVAPQWAALSDYEEALARRLHANEFGSDAFVASLDAPESDDTLVSTSLTRRGGTLRADIRLEGPRRERLREVLITGDFFMTPPRALYDLEAALHGVKSFIALYVGGMGAKGGAGRNFHKDLFVRMGYEEEADKIQDLYMSGRKDEAAQVVPDELADSIALLGPRDRVKDRLQAWRESRVTTMLVASPNVDNLRQVAEIL